MDDSERYALLDMLQLAQGRDTTAWALLAMAWVADGLSEAESYALDWFATFWVSDITAVEESVEKLALTWVADGVSLTEATVIRALGRIARLNAAAAERFIALPWIADGISDTEAEDIQGLGHIARRSAAVAGLSAAWGPGALDRVRRFARLPARVLFTVRNPYDVIASRALNRSRDLDGADIPLLRDYAPADSERANIGERDVRWFLDLSENISRVLAMFPEEDVLRMRYEDFIAAPKRICAKSAPSSA